MKDGIKKFHLVAEPVMREIAPGMKAKLWGYNGASPGPLKFALRLCVYDSEMIPNSIIHPIRKPPHEQPLDQRGRPGRPLRRRRDGRHPHDHDIALYSIDGAVFATDNLCTHGYARLCDGFLEHHEIECPFHQERFDVRTGTPPGRLPPEPLKPGR